LDSTGLDFADRASCGEYDGDRSNRVCGKTERIAIRLNMQPISPNEVAYRLAAGLLAFPVTHFTNALSFDEHGFREHIEWLLSHGPAGLFAAGGAGEFFSLTLGEFAHVVRAAVEQTRGRVPVIAGCGYGTAMAREFAHAAEDAGADGLLLMPPYLVNSEPAGLVQHVADVCASTRLAVIVYSRDNAVFDEQMLDELCERAPNLVGFKDGTGDLECMRRIRERVGERLTCICGMPTAEAFALEYFAMGFATYSSAIFNFVPRYALEFYRAAVRDDRDEVEWRMAELVRSLVELRQRGRGYAVSIVKAGMRAVGRPAGPVRPPLTELRTEEMKLLEELVRGRS
jgi:5-dehydro-4-deoxyglucarate dehydratase